MKGIVFTGDRKLELQQFPDPTPGPGEVVIEMKASGMCGSDLHQYRRPKTQERDSAPERFFPKTHRACNLVEVVGSRHKVRCIYVCGSVTK